MTPPLVISTVALPCFFTFSLSGVAQALAQQSRVPGDLPPQVPRQAETLAAGRAQLPLQADSRHLLPYLFGALPPGLLLNQSVHHCLLSRISVDLARSIQAGVGKNGFARVGHVWGAREDGPFGPYGSKRGRGPLQDGSRKVTVNLGNAYGATKPAGARGAAYQVVNSRLVKGMTEGRNALSEEFEPGRFGDRSGARRDPELAQGVGRVAVVLSEEFWFNCGFQRVLLEGDERRPARWLLR